MRNVIPSATGLTVDGVIYQYTAVKNEKDPMTVSIQNKNAIGEGYIFRNVDDWTGLRGSTITKVVPVDNIPGKYWGDGEISVRGIGEVRNPLVQYKYRYDTCATDVLSDPSCPGYADAWLKKLSKDSAEVKDPLSDENIKRATENKVKLEDLQNNNTRRNTAESEKKDTKKSDKKVEPPILVSPKDAQIAVQFDMMNNIPGFNLYSIAMPGGVYTDVLRYPEKTLPDNRQGRRLGLAQENLHKAMVDLQYER
jgi:hypothetical protein